MIRFIDEIRFVLRQLRKAPGFSLTVLLTVALGIASTTVIFSLVNAVLLRPLPFPRPERLVSLDTLQQDRGSGVALLRGETSYPNFFDWRRDNRSFSSMASYTTGGLVLGATANGPARSVPAAQVSSDFFTTLGVLPELGRDFRREEELPGSRVVVLSHELWKNEFAGDAKIVGHTVVLSERQYTVVGVMPAGFRFPMTGLETAAWVTMAREMEGKNASGKQRGWNQLSVVARLRDGVTIEQAKAEMDAIQQRLAKQYPDEDANEQAVSVIPQLEDMVANVKKPLRILFMAVSCLLLIVCANVAGLLLSRTSQRRGELALRSALGATRGQILRQLLIESVVLSLSGGALGLAGATLLLKLAPGVLPANLPRAADVALSWPVLAFALIVSLLTGLIFGVLPAWIASKQDPARALGDAGRSGMAGRRHYRLQSTLVVAQTAMGLVLLVCAGLLIRSFERTLKTDPGFAPDGLVTFRVSVPKQCCGEPTQVQFVQQLIARMKALPGVRSASAAYPLPLNQGDMTISFSIQGRPNAPGGEPSARASVAEPDYFKTMGIPLKSGRFFLTTEQDRKGAAVAIVNEAFAKKFFPGENAVGQHILSGLGSGDGPDDNPPMREIVGVVGNVKRLSLTEPDQPEYYVPFEQAPITMPGIAMRVAGDPESYAPMITAEVAKLDRNLPVYHFGTYADDMRRVTAEQRFQTLLLTGFAAMALILTGLGLYGVLSYMVAQRTQELGLRIALGATRGNVLQLVLNRGLSMTAVGIVAGIAGAAALTRFLAGLLYAVKPLDAATFLVTTLVLLAVSSLACLIPAIKACKLDPNQTLRQP